MSVIPLTVSTIVFDALTTRQLTPRNASKAAVDIFNQWKSVHQDDIKSCRALTVIDLTYQNLVESAKNDPEKVSIITGIFFNLSGPVTRDNYTFDHIMNCIGAPKLYIRGVDRVEALIADALRSTLGEDSKYKSIRTLCDEVDLWRSNGTIAELRQFLTYAQMNLVDSLVFFHYLAYCFGDWKEFASHTDELVRLKEYVSTIKLDVIHPFVQLLERVIQGKVVFEESVLGCLDALINALQENRRIKESQKKSAAALPSSTLPRESSVDFLSKMDQLMVEKGKKMNVQFESKGKSRLAELIGHSSFHGAPRSPRASPLRHVFTMQPEEPPTGQAAALPSKAD